MATLNVAWKSELKWHDVPELGQNQASAQLWPSSGMFTGILFLAVLVLTFELSQYLDDVIWSAKNRF